MFLLGTSGDGLSSFVSSLTTGLSIDNVWGAVAPVGALIIVACLVGITRRLISKNLSSITAGKSGKAK